jgi:4'-phosphopantetheinyl transferase EntD
VIDRGQDIALHPREAAHIAGAGDVRRRDFALGRFCARAALARLGYANAVIARQQNGAPVWPAGIVGSITHTKGYAAAMAGNAHDFLGVGIDAERIGGVTEDLFPRLFTVRERAALAALDGDARHQAATVFFSAKESFFKAGFSGPQLSFRAIEIEVEGDALLANGRRGRFAAGDGLVLTVLAPPV